MIESLACGTPVVTFDVMSAHEIVGEHAAGIVVPQGDYRLLAEAIGTILSDAELRRRMGERGTQLARELFDPERVQMRYKELYERLAMEAA
jgi:glycosyltransferase involved in cell wall biosynthesis